MSPTNSLLVGYRLLPVARREGPYRPGQRWAEPDVDHAAELLRRLHGDRAWARRIGEAARADVAARLTPLAVAETYRTRIAALLRGARRDRSHPDSLAFPESRSGR
jgi:hypothetical protein